MASFAIKQNAFSSCEEMRGASIPVFCPKPRRVGQLAGPDPLRSVRWHASNQSDLCDKAGAALDLVLSKGGEVATSPPFFAGSPPTRSANPVVHDSRFGEPDPAPVSVSPLQKSGRVARAKFGFEPAPVRVEGFDCRLDSSRRGAHSISAVA